VTIPDIPARFVPKVEANPNTVTSGVSPETVEFSITITNSGTVGDTQIVVTTVTDSDGTEVFRETIEQTLPANRLIVKEQTWDSSPDPVGEYTVTVSTVDGTATDPITLQEPTQNYQIDNLALPQQVQRGGSFTVDATITNTGEVSGVDIPITRRYAPAGDDLAVEEDIPLSLSVGETQTQSREISTSAGQDISKNNQVTVNTADDTASDTIETVDTSFYGFESGETSRWTGSNLLSVVNNTTAAPDTFGAFSGESFNLQTTERLATLNPFNVVGGKTNVDIINFASQNQVRDEGHGAGVQVLNSNGNVEVGAATFCDQNTTSDRFFAQVAGGIKEFDTDDINFGGPTGEGGRAIFKFEFYFDEPAKYVSVQVKWGGPPTEYASLLSYENMIQGTDVETLVLRPFNPTDGFGGPTTVSMKWDEFFIRLQ
jgi:hypothetical protein